MHFAIASIDESGDPHITPIGSLILREAGKGIFFPKYTRQLLVNLKTNDKVCVLAVNSGRFFWVKSLISGKFSRAPGMRLFGTVGPARKATDRELKLWLRRISPFRWMRGYILLWGNMTMVRDIHFTRAEPLNLGKMM